MHEQLAAGALRPGTYSGARRRSLLTLAGAEMAAVVVRPSSVFAGKDARKARKRSRKTCNRQVDPCRASITSLTVPAPTTAHSAGIVTRVIVSARRRHNERQLVRPLDATP